MASTTVLLTIVSCPYDFDRSPPCQPTRAPLRLARGPGDLWGREDNILNEEMQTPDSPFFNGTKLWGDDFDERQIEAWFETEKTAYANLYGASARTIDDYQYHHLNRHHGFRYLTKPRYKNALGLGSAFGAEFLPLVRDDRVEKLTIVEPSEEFRSPNIGHLVPQYIMPNSAGTLPFGTGSFDLAIALGVLHHIPNVSKVVSELLRCLSPGGELVLSEPVISMGDWRGDRQGLTKNERGIPKDMLVRMVEDGHARVRSARSCQFPTTGRLEAINPLLGFGSRAGVFLDDVLSRTFDWNYRYHAVRWGQKLRPTTLFLVAEKM